MLLEVRCWKSLEVTGFMIPRAPRRDGIGHAQHH